MTAGQRNCYLALQECLDRYQLADVAFALREHLIERMQREKSEGRTSPRCYVRVANALADLHAKTDLAELLAVRKATGGTP